MKKHAHEKGMGDDDGAAERRAGEELLPLTIKVRADLYRAFHRCSWILIHETGRDQIDIMREMVEDFLIKHQC